MRVRHPLLPLALLSGLLLVGCADSDTDPIRPSADATDAIAPESAHMGAGSEHAPAARNFVAPLEGGQEVPPVETRARGMAHFQVSADGESVEYRLLAANIENVLMAHIHLAPAGENGGVVVWLYPPDGPPPQLIEGRFNGVLAEATFTEADLVGSLAGASLDDLLEAMREGGAYVNVHTEQNPGGEIRGQIQAAGAH